MTRTTKYALFFGAALLLLGAGFYVQHQQQPAYAAAAFTVYKTPTCGCCAKWVDHLREAGFEVETQDLTDLSGVKTRYAIPRALRSCHTGVVEGYVIEGHIPAEHVERLLEERPEGIVGIAVPGMPIGSPGMEGPNPEAYDVLAFDAEGNTEVFARVTP